MRFVYLGFAASVLLFWIVSCFFYPFYINKRTVSGHSAVHDWGDKYHSLHRRDPSRHEVDVYRDRLKAEVERYIGAHSNLTERKKSELRRLYVYPGMTKTEVTLFLNSPVEVVQDLQEIAKRAGKFWSELQGRVDEVWGYDPYTYFFQGETLVDIHIRERPFDAL